MREFRRQATQQQQADLLGSVLHVGYEGIVEDTVCIALLIKGELSADSPNMCDLCLYL